MLAWIDLFLLFLDIFILCIAYIIKVRWFNLSREVK